MQIIKTIIISSLFICLCHAFIVYLTQLLTPTIYQDVTGVVDKYKKIVNDMTIQLNQRDEEIILLKKKLHVDMEEELKQFVQSSITSIATLPQPLSLTEIK